MQLDGTGWRCIAQVPFLHHRGWGTLGIDWTTGDLDGDGNDEIVACQDSLITCYQWAGGGLQTHKTLVPFLVDQVQIGDVNNDGRNELVLFCEDSTGQTDFYPYYLRVASWAGSRLVWLWDDSMKLGYSVCNMPDYLVCIADLTNKRHNQVLVSESQSDVSPTTFHLLTWNRKVGGLELAKSFAVHERLVPVDRQDTMPGPWESGPLHPFVVNDTTWFLGWYPQYMDDGPYERGFRFLRFEDESLAASLPRFRNLPEAGSLFLDPDGKGIGLLLLREPIVAVNAIRGQPPDVLKGSRFRFFRL